MSRSPPRMYALFSIPMPLLAARVDYAAIAILIVGSAVPFLHYG